jgi:hypothetical protein
MSSDLLDPRLAACHRRVEIAEWHHSELSKIIDDAQANEIALQAHFEGALTAGIAAYELFAKAVTEALTGSPDTRSNHVVLALRGAARDDLGRKLEAWKDRRFEDVRLLTEAQDVRNGVEHDFYEKHGARPFEWHYEVREDGRPNVFHSKRIDLFLAEWVGHLRELRSLAEQASRELPARLTTERS